MTFSAQPAQDTWGNTAVLTAAARRLRASEALLSNRPKMLHTMSVEYYGALHGGGVWLMSHCLQRSELLARKPHQEIQYIP